MALEKKIIQWRQMIRINKLVTWNTREIPSIAITAIKEMSGAINNDNQELSIRNINNRLIYK